MSTIVNTISTSGRISASLNSVLVVGDYKIELAAIDGGCRLTVRCGEEVQTMDIPNGADGGTPTLTVSEIEGGHRVTITNPNGGLQSFDVMDGDVGLPGGGTPGQILTKTEDGQEWQDAPEVPEITVDSAVTENGANAVSGAAVAAYVSAEIAKIADYEGVSF